MILNGALIIIKQENGDNITRKKRGTCSGCAFFEYKYAWRRDNGYCNYHFDVKKARNHCKQYMRKIPCPHDENHRVGVTCAKKVINFIVFVVVFGLEKMEK